MSRTWFWSDLHLGHEYVAKTRGFDGAPSGKLSAAAPHDINIMTGWMQHVKPKDTIWILGDISGGRNEEYALDLIAGLPGTKHLIAGNHDSVSSIHRNGWKKQARFLEVFASVQQFARIKVQKQNVLLSHFPYAGAGDHKEEERHMEYRLTDVGLPLVHGHVHAAWDKKLTEFAGTPMLNVGVDHWFDRPANIEDIIEWLRLEEVISR